MKLKNYINNYTGENRIYSLNDIVDMSFGDVLKNKEELISQYKVLGVPTKEELQNSDNVVYVHAYTREDGIEVKGHYRSKPEGSVTENNADNKITNEDINTDEKGSATGGASEVHKHDGMSIVEKIQEFGYEKALHQIFPMSSDATINGMHDMDAAKKDNNATITEGLSTIDSKKNIDYLKSMGAKDSDKGVIYNEHSDIAINFKNSPELEEHLAKIKDDVVQGKALKDEYIVFESNKKDFLNNNEKIDRHAFIHKAMIVDQKVDDNGVYTAKILDYSNFEDKPIEKILDIPNKWGYDMQERGLYTNFYVVINIKKKVNW